MENSINFHHILWNHTLEMAKWTPLLGKTLDEGLRNHLNPFIQKDIDMDNTYYNPFEIEEYNYETYLDLDLDSVQDLDLDLSSTYKPYIIDDTDVSSDEDDDEYFAVD